MAVHFPLSAIASAEKQVATLRLQLDLTKARKKLIDVFALGFSAIGGVVAAVRCS